MNVETGTDATAFRASTPRLLFDDLDRSRMTSSYYVARDGDAILLPASL